MTPKDTVQPRKQRNINTMFSIRDVIVVIGAAIAASGPFFAYDTRISVVENNNQQIESKISRLVERADRINEIDQDIRSRVDKLEAMDDRLREYINDLRRENELLRQDIRALQTQK
jgi:peptidoglycan hydrolase CwlO-like protein